LLTKPLHDADFNASGTVDAADLTHWSTGFGATGDATPTQGDANSDQTVDGADFLIWQRQVAAASVGGQAAAVPEPRSWLLFATTLLASLVRRHRRS
jgi:hypothetical protein